MLLIYFLVTALFYLSIAAALGAQGIMPSIFDSAKFLLVSLAWPVTLPLVMVYVVFSELRK